MFRFIPVILISIGSSNNLSANDGLFVDRVAPVFANRCLVCHNEADPKGGLSLTTAKGLLDSEFVVPGEAKASRLMEVISLHDGEAEMPKDARPLSESQILSIEKWIDRGADWPTGFEIHEPGLANLDWWSLRPIRSSTSPPESHPVDWFIDRSLKQHGLQPLGDASPQVLVRRLFYDLTGLPPEPKEVDAFVEASRENESAARAALVERLLDSPAFGEKWGQHWLDIARYAETHGYDKDKPRNNAWPYRDYVIRSFNEDKPYPEFAREQVAGDVLAEDRSTGIAATGFLAAGPWDLIAHSEVGEEKLDGRIAKHLDRDEMAAAVFNVFLSTTIQCAQCHDHKFDPVASKDYYRVHAVFAGIDRADRVYAGLSAEQERRKQTLQAERAELARKRADANKQLEAKIARQASSIDPRIKELSAKVRRKPPSRHGFHSTIVGDQHTTKWIQVDLGTTRPVDFIELIACFDDFNGIGEGFGFPVRFRVEVTADEAFQTERARLWVDHSAADFSNPLSRPVRIQGDGKPVRLIRVTATKLAHRKDDYILALSEVRAFQNDASENVAKGSDVTFSDAIPKNARWSPDFLVDGLFMQQSLSDADMAELEQLHDQRKQIEQEIRTNESSKRLSMWNARITELDRELSKIPKGQMVYAAATHFAKSGKFAPTEGRLRPIHFLARGDLTAPEQRMFPGVPRLWDGSPTDFFDSEEYVESEARAALASHLTRRDNPLLWRSIANRIWQWTFGKPLVGTPNDFGRMGMKPTHPELLDYLAARLRDDPNHSLKSIIRLLVSSRAYQRASTGDQDLVLQNARADSTNEHLWRYNRRRLTAEEIRDSVLAVAGALQANLRGGPSFKDFVIERPQHSPHYEYHLHDPNDQASHRRSIYRFVVRSQPQPMLMTLDCADPSISVPRRDESTTALQALTHWNHRLVEAMSVRMAERLRSEPVDEACRLAWGRLPNEMERSILESLVSRHGVETLCRVVMNANAMVYLD